MPNIPDRLPTGGYASSVPSEGSRRRAKAGAAQNPIVGPGSGGPPEPIGPLVLDPTRNEDPPVRKLPASRASALCGKHLDWVEALP
jgi:hypothetical protein